MPTPIEQTVTDYFAAIRAMDTERCVALFAEDAEQQDPVGAPANMGHASIRVFFAGIFSAFQSVDLTEEAVYANGNSAAIKWTGHAVAPSGTSIGFAGIDVLDVNDAGKIIRVRAFWNPAPVLAILES